MDGPTATGMVKAGTRCLVWLLDTTTYVEVTEAQIERIAVTYAAAMVPTQTCTALPC